MAIGIIEAYIRQAAIARGIDPDIAVRVAMSEGGLTNPVRKSEVPTGGGRTEESYGPFQLYMGGGLGNRALAAGIDPRDPNQWQAGVDFALDEAKRAGWGQWYGAAKAGIGNWAGLGGKGSTAPTTYQVGPGFKGKNPNYVAPTIMTAGLGATEPQEPDPAATGRAMLAGLGQSSVDDEELLAMALAAMRKWQAGGQAEPPPQMKLKRTLAEAPKRTI